MGAVFSCFVLFVFHDPFSMIQNVLRPSPEHSLIHDSHQGVMACLTPASPFGFLGHSGGLGAFGKLPTASRGPGYVCVPGGATCQRGGEHLDTQNLHDFKRAHERLIDAQELI